MKSYKTSTAKPLRVFFSQFRKDQQGSNFGLPSPPRI